jgi:hypothetical protein
VVYSGGLKFGMLVEGRSCKINVKVPWGLKVGVAFEKNLRVVVVIGSVTV